MEKLNEFITNPEDCEVIMAYSFEQTKEIYKENKRLKAQLDREIKINRKMKRALEKYAFENTKMEIPHFIGNSLQPQNEVDLCSPLVNKPVYDGVEEIEVPYAFDKSLALQVLKEIDNKE